MTAKRPLHALLKPETLFPSQARSTIEQRLRSAILDGTIKPGTPVRQQELADLYSVSRMPAREAIRQLEAQGLLVGSRHRGVIVRERPEGPALIGGISKAELLGLLENYPDDAKIQIQITNAQVETGDGDVIACSPVAAFTGEHTFCEKQNRVLLRVNP